MKWLLLSNKKIKIVFSTFLIISSYLTIIYMIFDYTQYGSHIVTLFSVYGSNLLCFIFVFNALWKPFKGGWQNFLSHTIIYKIMPLMVLVSITYNTVIYALNPLHFTFLNYNWTFISFITWSSCFVATLLILNKKNIPPIEALLFTSFNYLLMKDVWEIPTWSIYVNRLISVSIQQSAINFFTYPQIFIPLIIIPLMLWKYKWKPNALFIIATMLCVFTFVFFWQLPIWILRIPFATLPIIFALNIKN